MNNYIKFYDTELHEKIINTSKIVLEEILDKLPSEIKEQIINGDCDRCLQAMN